jgi:hypothetical protein
MNRVIFPRRSYLKNRAQPITGRLDSIKLTDEQADLVGRIVAGLFLDMQDKPLSDVLAACYITGLNHGASND